ncbi:MAG: sporulation integral membrane protein YtvI [Bacillota bacterium]|nr:sporulation integral membrane protein YtvI [Bacillota bacterium]
MTKEERYKSFLLKSGYWAAIVLIAVVFIKYLLGPLTPFLIALAIAMPMQPVARKIAKRTRINRRFASVVLVLLCYLVLVALVALLVAGIASVIVDFADMLPDYFVESIQPAIEKLGNNIIDKLDRFIPNINDKVNNAMPDIVSQISGTVMNFSVAVLTWASDVGSKLPGFLLGTVICVIASIFLAVDYDKAATTVMGILPLKVREILLVAKRALGAIVGKYLKSYMIILLMTFAELAIGLWIVGIGKPLRIAALIAVFDILPIVGSGLVLAPWAIINLIQGNYGIGVGLAVLWVIVIVVREYAEPRIVGKQVGLHPLVTLVCLWVGLKLGGALGMFALPIGLLVILDLKAEGIISFEKNDETLSDGVNQSPEPEKSEP